MEKIRMPAIALCDDEPKELERTTELLREWMLKQERGEITLSSFSSPDALLDEVSGGAQFDIFLLDILMPRMNGISLGEQLQHFYPEPLIIYLTSSEDFYPDAFRLYAFQYIRKPAEKQQLFSILDRAFIRCGKQKKRMFSLKSSGSMMQIPMHTIVYVELLAHVCYVHLSDGSTLQSQYLRTKFNDFILPLLQSGSFIKTHRSFAVNLNYAGRLTSKNLITTTGANIPVARTLSDDVQRQYMAFALQDERSTL